MATRDILVLNTTASRAETQQGSDTVVIRGNSGEALSVENSSGTSILSVNTVSSSIDVAGKINVTTNVSSSLTSTGSFGRVEATTLVGDAFNLTGTAIDGTISSSGQIANQISGAFRQGFEFDGTIGSVAGHTTTASFDRIVATVFSGSAANLTNVALEGTISSSAQIATQISGAFIRGFDFTGTISGSATSTGSFGQIFAKKAVGNVSAMTNLVPKGTVSGSGQLATAISGAFDVGFEFTGMISGSVTSTGSFSNIKANKVFGDVSAMTGLIPSGIVSSSAQIASRVSGSFNKGFEFSGTIKKGFGTWAVGADMINNRCTTLGPYQTTGTKSAVMTVQDQNTELWNGSSWSEVNNRIDDNLYAGGAAGTSTSAILYGAIGTPTYGAFANTEEWNGTNWSEGTDLITARYAGGSAGYLSSENALYFGGNKAPVAAAETEEWNGSAWSEVNDLITARSGTGVGTTEAALLVGGSPVGNTEEWNGTNWSEVTANAYAAPSFHSIGGGGGTVNDAHVYGSSTSGAPYRQRESLLFDGTSWSQDAALNTVRRYVSGRGSTSGNVIALGGSDNQKATETYTVAAATTGSFGRIEATSISGDGSNLTGTALTGTISSSGQIASQISGAFTSGFTVSGDITTKDVVFSSGGDLNCTEDYNMTTYRGAAGNKNAGLIYGGYRFGYGPAFRSSGYTEEYDGTTWTEVNDMIDNGATSGGGTSEAAIATGGNHRTGCTEEWNGTNWTEVNNQILNNTGNGVMKTLSIGQSSEALVISGFEYQAPYGHTEEWNGTNWATANPMNHSSKAWHGGAGTANAGITAGGPFGSNVVSCTEEWNGTNWTEGPSALISNMKAVSMAGSQNDTLLAGFVQNSGYQSNGLLNNPNTNSADTICWNGISWATSATLGVRRMGMSAAGQNSNVAFFASGLENASPYKAECTIEVETFVATASFSHIDALRITGSVDLMTNIPEPIGTISGSAQLASSISGSFNKGFEFSGEIKSFGAWSVGADFTGCYTSTYGKYGYSAIGTRDAAIVAGAYGVYEGWVSNTYAYNGIAWSDTGNNLIQGGSHSAHGTANAGLAIGRFSRAPGTGYFYTCTEEYNGSAWSETTDLPYKLKNLNNQSAGTQNAALTAGGNCDTGNDLDAIKRHALAWDGLSYSHVGDLSDARDSAALVGTMNAALAQGGGSDSSTNDMASDSTCTEEWNGSAWSTAAASNFPTGCGVMASGKSSNDSMHVYDAPNASQKSDVYNGTTWNLGPNMIGDGRHQDYGAAGTTAKSFFMTRLRADVQHFDENHVTSSIGRVDATELSLESDTDLTVNESLQIPQYATNPPITSSAGEVWYNTAEEKLYFTYDINSWSEVTDTNTSHAFGGYAGGTGDGIVWGSGGNTINSEVWNGNTWTEVNDLNTGRSYVPGAGSSNAAIAAGGCILSTNITEIWDGTSWTEVNDGAIGYSATYTGTVNAGLQAGCRNAGNQQPQVDTKEWNGTNWSAGGDLITAKADYAAMAGTQNAAKHMGGGGGAFDAPLYITNLVEDYNGTSFSTATSLPHCVHYTSGGGTQNAAIIAGGKSSNSNASAETYEWNGVSFNQTANLVNGRCTGDIADGSQSSFQVSSGGSFGSTTCKNTEQYTTTGIGCHCIGGV